MGHSGTDWDIYPPYQIEDIQLRAIELTLQGLSDKQVADTLSINRKTLWRWKTLDEDYRNALLDARAQLYCVVSDRYRTLLMRSMGVLAKFLEDPSENTRFRAAYGLLTMAGGFKPMSQALPPPPREPDPEYMPLPVLPYKCG